MGILSEFIQWLPEYFFPKVCYGCEKEGFYVCDDCRKMVERVLDEPRCPECGKEATFGATHPVCRRQRGLDGLVSYYKYAGWAKEIVKEAKFGKHHRYAAMKEMAEEFAAELVNRESLIANRQTVVVPIPLHWWRKFKRGFNQAELMAEELAREWKIPMVKMLTRRKYTEPQTLTEKEVMLTKEQEDKLEEKYRSTLQRDYAGKKLLNQLKAKRRKENIRDAFEIDCHVARLRRTPRNDVILVDDVWTTGATMRECCRVLKRAGVKKVWGITLLRA